MSCLPTCPTMPRGLSGRSRCAARPTMWLTMWSPRSDTAPHPTAPGTFGAWGPGLWHVTPSPPSPHQVYAVATSTNTPCTRIPRMTGEEKEFETIERGARCPRLGPFSGPPSLTVTPLSVQMTVTSTLSRRPSPSSSSPRSAGRPSPTPGEAGPRSGLVAGLGRCPGLGCCPDLGSCPALG